MNEKRKKRKMKNFQIIIFFLILNQILAVEYKETSAWRINKTVHEERIACQEICKECFNDVNFSYYFILHLKNIYSNCISLSA